MGWQSPSLEVSKARLKPWMIWSHSTQNLQTARVPFPPMFLWFWEHTICFFCFLFFFFIPICLKVGWKFGWIGSVKPSPLSANALILRLDFSGYEIPVPWIKKIPEANLLPALSWHNNQEYHCFFLFFILSPLCVFTASFISMHSEMPVSQLAAIKSWVPHPY